MAINSTIINKPNTKNTTTYDVGSPGLEQAQLWRSVLVVEEAGVPGENHRPWTSNW
jgi:hypothetical protein